MTVAVEDISLAIAAAETYGLLGPCRGAQETTTIERVCGPPGPITLCGLC